MARHDAVTLINNEINPDALLEQLADRLEAADAEIARLRGLIVWLANHTKDLGQGIYESRMWIAGPPGPENEAIEQIVREEGGEK